LNLIFDLESNFRVFLPKADGSAHVLLTSDTQFNYKCNVLLANYTALHSTSNHQQSKQNCKVNRQLTTTKNCRKTLHFTCSRLEPLN